MVGTSHTYLLKLGEYKDYFFNNESVRLNYVQGDNGFDAYLNMYPNDHIFIIGKDKISEVSLEQAKEAVRDYVIPAVKEWEKHYGTLPKRCKVKVKLNNISISRLKQLIRDCEVHNDTSLVDALIGFHRYRQMSSDHYIQVSYNPGYNEFGFVNISMENPVWLGALSFMDGKKPAIKKIMQFN